MGVFIIALVGPVVARVLLSLGIGVLTFTAFTLALSSLETAVIGNLNSLPADALAYLTISGFIDGIGILLGAIGVRVALTSLPKFGKIA